MKPGFDHIILLLQGGGALGAYQAGAYQGLSEAGFAPDWVVGISIGGINAAIIAGNPPGRRVERLREFWERVSSHAPVIPPRWLDPARPLLNQMSATASIMNGVPGFFTPRVPPPSFYVPGEPPDRLGFYDTEPLKRTLEELVDFNLINRNGLRLSLGTASLRTGQSVYFDNEETRIGPDHVRASGALPPGLPPVEVDGEYYWDGGIVSNSPLLYVFDHLPHMKALVIQIDIFKADGELPEDMDEVMRRELDIRYSSRVPFSSRRIRRLAEMHCALKRVLSKLPPSLKNDPDVRKLMPARDLGEMTIARLTNRGLSHAGYSMDYEFSRATIEELWKTGLDDVRQSVKVIERMQPSLYGSFARVYELPYGSAPPPETTAEREAEGQETETPQRPARGGRSRRRPQQAEWSAKQNGRRAGNIHELRSNRRRRRTAKAVT